MPLRSGSDSRPGASSSALHDPHSLPSLTILDIGARGGAHPRWASCAAPTTIIGFDAEPAGVTAVGTMRILPYALSDRVGEATLHVTKHWGNTSLLTPNYDFVRRFPYGRWAYEIVKDVPISTTTLDLVCEAESLSPDVIKVDTQGSELAILRGASRVLPHVLLVESEVEFNEVYVGQPLFGDLDAYLRAQGFTLLRLRRDLWRESGRTPTAAGGTLIHGDALWLHQSRLDNADPPTLLKAIAALSAYGHADAVVVLCERAQRRDLLPLVLRADPWWARLIGSVMRHIGPHRWWRAQLDRCCAPDVEDWHDP